MRLQSNMTLSPYQQPPAELSACQQQTDTQLIQYQMILFNEEHYRE